MNNINRHNYEEYFLLYIDDELSAAERRAVEEFVELHPDLKIELDMLEQSTLHAEPVVFHDKDVLLKNSSSLINESNCEEFFVLYGDDELTNEQKDSVEQFVYRNPAYQAEFELIQKARLHPDTHIVFQDKTSLYRSEQDDEKVFVLRWWKIAAAAAVLVFLSGLGWYMIPGGKTPQHLVETVPTPTSEKPANKTSKPEQEIIAKADESISTSDTEPSASQTHSSPVNNAVVAKKSRSDNQVSIHETEAPVQTLAAREKDVIQKEKNSEGSNIQIVSAVTHKKAEVNVGKIEPTNQVALMDTKEIIDVAVGAPETNPYAFTTSHDEIEILNTSVSKKNKLRGLFRKVTRVVEKTTNIETDGKGLRIANFEIALK